MRVTIFLQVLHAHLVIASPAHGIQRTYISLPAAKEAHEPISNYTSRDVQRPKNIGTEPEYVAFENAQDKLVQVKQAVSDAYELAGTAFMAFNEGIYKHYFEVSFENFVTNAFKRIVDVDTGLGLPRMSQVTITNIDAGNGCVGKPYIMAYIDNRHTKNPSIHFCDNAFKFGSITGSDPINPDTLGPRVNMKMVTMGQFLLHEFVHWDQIGKDAVGSSANDECTKGKEDCYGCYNVRFVLDEGKRLTNADNFAWYATENFWTSHRQHQMQYEPPTVEDQRSPFCDGKNCEVM